MAEDDTEILASNEPARNGYGQNGFEGPASDTNMPGKKKTTSGFLPQAVIKKTDDQTRYVSAEQKVPTTHGMHNPNSNPVKIPRVLSRGSPRGR